MSAKKRLVRKNRRQRRGERLAKRLSIGKGSAVALALGLGLAAGAPAEAAIFYSGLVNTTISNATLDFLTYQPTLQNQFTLYQSVSGIDQIGLISGKHSQTYAVSSYYTVLPWVDKLNAGTTINSSGPWVNAYYPSLFVGAVYNSKPHYPLNYGYFLGQKGYVGLKFYPDGNGFHYGWAQLSMPADGSSITLYDWACNDVVDEQIKAGQTTPLPSSLVLLATGALGLLGFRRVTRKK